MSEEKEAYSRGSYELIRVKREAVFLQKRNEYLNKIIKEELKRYRIAKFKAFLSLLCVATIWCIFTNLVNMSILYRSLLGMIIGALSMQVIIKYFKL